MFDFGVMDDEFKGEERHTAADATPSVRVDLLLGPDPQIGQHFFNFFG